MDSTLFGESQYINVELVKMSKTKAVYIKGDAKKVIGIYGERLELPVEIDGKDKLWTLNRQNVKSLQRFGKDTKDWVGESVNLHVVEVKCREQIIAQPIIVREEIYQ